jgi:broad specificity phosphatase PhoE
MPPLDRQSGFGSDGPHQDDESIFIIFVPIATENNGFFARIGLEACCCHVDPAASPAPVSAVFLARHASHDEVGRVLSGRSDIALSTRGRGEAARLADRLAGVPLAAIYSSPRRRARETAQVVAERHGLPVEDAEGLDEIDFGAWTGRSFEALADDPDWRRWNAQRGTAATPAGEDMVAATARAVRQIEAVAGDAPVLCVSHCDIIRGVVAHYLGLDMGRLLGFDVDPGSVTTLALFPGGGRIVALNERPL